MDRSQIGRETFFDEDHFTRSLIETAPTLIYVFDLVTGRNVFMSRQIETLFGYSPEDIKAYGSKLMAALGHPEEVDRISAHHTAIRNSRSDGPYEITYRLRHRDGTWRWLASREQPYARDEHGRVTQIVGSALDVTALKLGEQRLATALRSGDLGIHEYDVATDTIHWDQKTRELWGVDEDEPVTYATFEAGIHPDDLARVRKAVADAMTPAGGGKYFAEYRVISRRDGTVRWVAADADVTFEGGKVQRFVGLVRDVTEMHRYQDALAEQKRLYQSITDNASTSLFVMDHRQHCVFMNPAAVAMTGFTLEEVAGRPLHDVIHHTRPDGSHYPLSECPIDQAFPKNDLEKGEDVFIRKDGTFYPVAFTASPLRDANGTPIGTVIEVQDITERKRAEQALRESEHRYRTLFDRAAVGLAEVSPEGSWIRVNQALCDMLGYTRDELVSLTWQQITHPEDLPADLAQVEAVFRGETDTYRFAKRYFSKSGDVVYAQLTVTCVRKPDGSVDYFLPIVENVTATRRAERALQASEARYRAVVEDQTEMLCRFRDDGTLLLVNNAYAEAHGTHPAAMEGRSLFDFLAPAAADKIRAVVASLTADEPANTSVYRVRRRDGSMGWQEWVNRRVLIEGEVAYQATGRDVTDQIAAERKLIQSRERLRLAARAASLTYITLDLSAKKITRLDNFHDVMGFEIPDATPLDEANAIFLNHMHPDDREVMQRHVQEAWQGQAPGNIEFRVCDDAGAVRWIDCRSMTEQAPDGRVNKIFAINSDVTARKSIELQLEFATRELMHRSKNLLTVIQGIAQISARTSPTATDFVQSFGKRIEALARSQDLLVHGIEHGLEIRELILDQLSIAVGSQERADLSGPPLTLSRNAAQSLGLALHELATNALKYGAFATELGRVAIDWREDGKTFEFHWREIGGATVKPPTRSGFGRSVIERVSPSKLGGSATLTFEPAGLQWRLTAPLSAVIERTVPA